MPGWFTEIGEGDFLDERARSYYWPRHVAFCAETFGDLVYGWKPINEPAAYSSMYRTGGRSPRSLDWRRVFDLLEGVLLAQRDAWRELRGGGAPVATIHNLSPIFQVGETVQARTSRARTRRTDVEGLDARRSRRCARTAGPRRAPEVPDLREACDLVGFSYYSATGIDREGKVGPYPSGARVGPMGNAPWSEGLGIVLHRLHEELPGRPLLVCEHGVGTDDDEWRTDILRESLQIVDDALADGVDLRGFFHWTGVDNYEWPYGFDVQFGCFTRDREPKGSAELLRDYATAR